MSDLLNEHVKQKQVSSSNRESGNFDAVVLQNAIVSGPLRLPLNNAESFVREFNARYEKLGMCVLANKKIPGSV